MNYVKSNIDVFKNYKHLLGNLVRRDIKVKYRRSVLGVLWSFLSPLLTMLVMWFVFRSLFRNVNLTEGAQVVASTGQLPDFAVYLLSGQLIFNFFSEATTLAMEAILGNAPLIKKVYVPKYIFPLEKVVFALVNTMFSMLALALIIAIVGAPVSLLALLSPFAVALTFGFNLGVGIILSALVVFFRDIKHFYSVIVLALTYMTPIFYSESILDPVVSQVVHFNPMYWYVKLFRDLVVYGVAPEIRTWLVCVAGALVSIAVGLLIFRKTQDKFILHI